MMVIPLNLNLVTGTTKTKVMGAAYIPVQSKQLEFFIKIIAECESQFKGLCVVYSQRASRMNGHLMNIAFFTCAFLSLIG